MANKTISLEPKGFFEERQAKKSYPQRLRKVAEKYQNCFEVQDTLFGDNDAVQYLTSLAEDTLERRHHSSKEAEIFDNLEERFSNLADKVLVGNPHYQQPVFNLAEALQHNGFNSFASITYHALSETELEPHLRQQVRLGLIGTGGENLGMKKNEKITSRGFVEKQLADFINEDPAISENYDEIILEKAITNYGIDYGRNPSSEASLLFGSKDLWMESNKEKLNVERLSYAKRDLELALEKNPDLLLPIYLIETHYMVAGKSEIANVVSDVLAPHDVKTIGLEFTDKLIAKAREFRDLGMYNECVGVCDRVIINNPGNFHANYYKGTANMMAGNLEEAGISLSEAENNLILLAGEVNVAEKENLAQSLITLGTLSGLVDDKINFYQMSIAVHPTTTAKHNLGYNLAKNGQLDEAKGILGGLLEEKPNLVGTRKVYEHFFAQK